SDSTFVCTVLLKSGQRSSQPRNKNGNLSPQKRLQIDSRCVVSGIKRPCRLFVAAGAIVLSHVCSITCLPHKVFHGESIDCSILGTAVTATAVGLPLMALTPIGQHGICASCTRCGRPRFVAFPASSLSATRREATDRCWFPSRRRACPGPSLHTDQRFSRTHRSHSLR